MSSTVQGAAQDLVFQLPVDLETTTPTPPPAPQASKLVASGNGSPAVGVVSAKQAKKLRKARNIAALTALYHQHSGSSDYLQRIADGMPTPLNPAKVRGLTSWKL